jgi:hypothetical protein
MGEQNKDQSSSSQPKSGSSPDSKDSEESPRRAGTRDDQQEQRSNTGRQDKSDVTYQPESGQPGSSR